MKKLFAMIIVAIAAVPCLAMEREVICAKYRTTNGWSKGYRVEATIAKGSELNQATKTFNYSGLSTYVVIFWNKDEASIIEMDLPWLSPIAQEGKDLRGVKWEIAKTSICF